MSLCVALLAYNEAENLNVLLPRIKEQLNKINEDKEIIVIDSTKSEDNTEEVCNQIGEIKYYKQEWPSFGGAMRSAIYHATADKFLIMDSDGSHDPQYITDLYNTFTDGECDVCIGSRYTKGGVTNDKTSSVIMSKILNFAFRLCTGVKAKDLSTNFRIYYTDSLRNINLVCENYDVLEEILLKLKKDKAPSEFIVKEVPITFNKRIYGESKRRLLPFIWSYFKTIIMLSITRIKR